jgi:hypothetical protein
MPVISDAFIGDFLLISLVPGSIEHLDSGQGENGMACQ